MSTSPLNLLALGQPRLDLRNALLARGWRITEQFPTACEQSPDVVLFDHFSTEESFGPQVRQRFPEALRLLECNALQSLGSARQRLLQRRLAEGLDSNDFRALFATSGPDLYQQMAGAALTQREIAALYRCDLSLLPSDVEINLLVNGFGMPDHLLHWCPSLLSAEPARPFAERDGFIFLADFTDPASRDALLWLKHSLWPMLRRRLPEAQLQVHGVSLTARDLALHQPDEGFHVQACTEPAQALMSNARVCLAPLRFGGGIKRLLVDAIQCGTPSVTTPIGSEAMHGALPWPGSVVSLAEALADAAAQLYSDEARWQQAQHTTRQLIAQRYDARWHAEALVERIEQALMDLPQHRLFNFTGAMLCRLTDAATDRCP